MGLPGIVEADDELAKQRWRVGDAAKDLGLDLVDVRITVRTVGEGLGLRLDRVGRDARPLARERGAGTAYGRHRGERLGLLTVGPVLGGEGVVFAYWFTIVVGASAMALSVT